MLRIQRKMVFTLKARAMMISPVGISTDARGFCAAIVVAYSETFPENCRMHNTMDRTIQTAKIDSSGGLATAA